MPFDVPFDRFDDRLVAQKLRPEASFDQQLAQPHRWLEIQLLHLDAVAFPDCGVAETIADSVHTCRVSALTPSSVLYCTPLTGGTPRG